MIGVVLQRGDFVTIQGQVPAMVTFATEDGATFMLQFEAVIAITGTDLVAAGLLMMKMAPDGRYAEAATGAVINLERQQ